MEQIAGFYKTLASKEKMSSKLWLIWGIAMIASGIAMIVYELILDAFLWRFLGVLLIVLSFVCFKKAFDKNEFSSAYECYVDDDIFNQYKSSLANRIINIMSSFISVGLMGFLISSLLNKLFSISDAVQLIISLSLFIIMGIVGIIPIIIDLNIRKFAYQNVSQK